MSAGAVEVIHRGAPRLVLDAPDIAPLEPELERAVAAHWDAACARRPGLFNGKLLSATGFAGDALAVRYVEYRSFLAQRAEPALAARLGIAPIGISGIIMASDGGVVLGRRGAGVTQYPGWWEAVPSGSLDGRALGGREPAAGMVLEPEACLRAELREESGLGEADVARVRTVALMLDVAERTYDVSYAVEVREASGALRARLAARHDDGEYAEIVVLAPRELDALLARTGEVVPTTRALWELVRGERARDQAGGSGA